MSDTVQVDVLVVEGVLVPVDDAVVLGVFETVDVLDLVKVLEVVGVGLGDADGKQNTPTSWLCKQL